MRSLAGTDGEDCSGYTAALAAISRGILRPPQDPYIHWAVTVVARAMRLDHCALFLHRPGSRAMSLSAGTGWPAGSLGRARLAVNPRHQVGHTLAHRAAVIVDDVHADRRFRVPRLLQPFRFGSALTVPVPGPHHPLGVLAAYCPQTGRFGTEDRDFLQAAAGILAGAGDAGAGRTQGNGRKPNDARSTRALRRINPSLDRELTRQRPEQDTLRDRLTRLEAAVRGSNDGLWDATIPPGQPWHLPHTQVWYSPRFKELLGYGEGELQDGLESWTARLHPEDRERVFDAVARHIDQRAPYDTEYRLLTRSGEYRWFHARGQAVWDAQGRVVRMAGTLRDITQNKGMEAAIEAYLRYLEAMHQISEAIAQTTEISRMLQEVVHRIRLIFDSDRAWLLHPCDPEASWAVPVEDTRPEYPGASQLAGRLPIDDSAAEVARAALETQESVVYGPENPFPPNAYWRERFGIQSQIDIAVRPRYGKAWLLGMHQCSHARVWTLEDRQLFRDISFRLADALNHLLLYHDLQRSETRYRCLFETSVDGIYVIAPDGRFVDVNPAFCQMLGYDGRDAFLAAQGERHDYFRALRTRETALTKGVHTRLTRTDGTHLWVETRVQPISDAEGKVVFYQGITRDVTEAKQAEEVLRESESKFRALAETVPASVCFHRGRQVLYANSAATALTGYSTSELQSVDFMEIVHPDFQELVKDAEVACDRDAVPASRHEIQIITKTGEVRWVDFMVGTVEYGGQRAGLRTAFDITERRRAQAEMARLLEENRCLTRHRLHIQEEERRSLAHDLHDELGQCLSAIRADAVSICQRSARNDARIHESAQAIVTVSNRVQDVVRSMMRRLRPPALKTLGVVETLRAAILAWQEHQQVSCQFTARGDLATLGDAVDIQLYRIVQECLTNIAKHALATRADISLVRSSVPPAEWPADATAVASPCAGRDALYLRVCDNGCGIRAGGSRTGLGLLGMRERASSLRGVFQLQSRPGLGTCVAVCIPLANDPTEAPCAGG